MDSIIDDKDVHSAQSVRIIAWFNISLKFLYWNVNVSLVFLIICVFLHYIIWKTFINPSPTGYSKENHKMFSKLNCEI